MYGPPFYPESTGGRPRTESTGGHARRALQDLLIHNKKVKGGPPARSKLEDDMHKLRNKWPRQAEARQRRESLQQSITQRAQRDVLRSQLAQVRSQMPAWGGPAHHVAHRDYILEALRKLKTQGVTPPVSPPTERPSTPPPTERPPTPPTRKGKGKRKEAAPAASASSAAEPPPSPRSSRENTIAVT